MNTKEKRTLYASYVGYVTQAIINNLAPLLFVTFQHQYKITVVQIGFLVTFNFTIQILVDFFAAKYVDKIGYKPAIMAAHLFSAAGLIGLSVFPQLLPFPYWGLLAAIALYAVGGGLIEVLISPIVQALPLDEKSSAMSLLHSFYCWGHVAVVILSTVFFNAVGIENWRWLPILWAVIPLGNLLLFSGASVYVLNEKEESISERTLFSMKLFWLLFVFMICAGASEQAMSQWASYFAENGLKVSKTMGDLLGPCMFAVLMGVSRVFYGKFGEKIPLKKFISGSSLLCIAAYLITVFSPHPGFSLFGCALTGLSVGIMWPGAFSLGAHYCPLGGTAMFAYFALAGDVGCALGPYIVGKVSGIFQQNVEKGLMAALIFPIIVFCLVQILHKKKRD